MALLFPPAWRARPAQRRPSERKVAKITDIKTFLVDASPRAEVVGHQLALRQGRDGRRGSPARRPVAGPRQVIQTAIEDLQTILIGQDPTRIELLWQKMFLGMMGHGMTGVVGAGRSPARWPCGISWARSWASRWSISSAVAVATRCECTPMPASRSRPLESRGAGLYGPQVWWLAAPGETVRRLRDALPDDVDVCIDVHGPPWLTVPDAIRVGQELGGV